MTLRSFRALAAALAAATTACSSGGSGAQGTTTASTSTAAITIGTNPAADQLLRRGLDDEPRSLDPLLTNDVPGQRIADDLFEGLTTIDIAGRVVAGVASSWDVSPDGLAWTFHLRPSARWSNGASVTAADFIYAWRREVDPKTAAAYAQGLAPIEHALEIASGQLPVDQLGAEAIDPHTLTVHLTGPTPYLLDLLSQQYLYPVYQPTIRQYGDDWVRPEHMVCNGPFVLRERIIGSRISLEKNANYWDAAHVRLQHVSYYVLPDRSDQAQRYLANELDWTDSFAANQRSWLQSRLGDEVVNAPYFGSYFLGMNFQLPPFRDNPALRRALVLAVDREPLVRNMKQGMYEPAYTLMPPLPAYESPIPDWKRLTDEERHALARRLYRQAGYSESHPLQIHLDVPSQGPDSRHFFEALVATWHGILGADVQLYEREFSVLAQERALHKLPLFFDAWIGDYPDPYTFMQISYTNNGNNYDGYSNPEFDRLIDAAGQESDNARRYRVFERAETLLNQDAAYIPLYYYATRHLVKPYLRGWRSSVMDRNLSRYMYLLEHQER